VPPRPRSFTLLPLSLSSRSRCQPRSNGSLDRVNEPLDQYNESLHRVNVTLYLYNEALHRYNEPLNQYNGSLHRVRPPERLVSGGAAPKVEGGTKAVETPQVLNDIAPQATGTAGRLRRSGTGPRRSFPSRGHQRIWLFSAKRLAPYESASSLRASPASIPRAARSAGRMPCALSRSSCRPERRGLHPHDPVTHRSIPISIRSSAEAGSCVSRQALRYTRRDEIAVQESKHEAEPSLVGPRNAPRRLSGLVGWRRGQPVKRPARD
jgi:hypothetical protein